MARVRRSGRWIASCPPGFPVRFWFMAPLPLLALSRDDEGRVYSVSAQATLRDRLQDLGVIPGQRIRLLQGGSRCILLVNECSRLCLRAEEAAGVLVTLV